MTQLGGAGKLAAFDTALVSHKNFVLMWETTPMTGSVSGNVDDNVVEMARVGPNEFQLNLRTGDDADYGPGLSPFQAFAAAIGSIIA